MNEPRLKRSMYDLRDRSTAQRCALAAMLAFWVTLAWWVLFGGGVAVIGGFVGRNWQPGDVVRRAMLAAALSLYFARVLATTFVFLKRGMAWSEVLTIGVWTFLIFAFLAVEGGKFSRPFGVLGWAGAALYVLGSSINSYSELRRYRWKRHPENRNCLYTESLFRWTRHPNYLGDLLLFSGLCLISGVWFTAWIPVLMLLLFVFVNIPMLDSHLRDHYGASFDAYAKHTAKLIPFVY